MRTASIQKCHDDYERKLDGYGELAEDLLHPESSIRGALRNYLVEMIVIRMVEDLNSFLFELMAVHLNNDPGRIRVLPGDSARKRPNMQACRAIIIKGRVTLKYRGSEGVVEISRNYLPDESNPFFVIDRYQDSLAALKRMRNYCVHHSDLSRNSLLKLYRSESRGYRGWIEPAHFLLGDKGKRLLAYLAVLSSISQDMREQGMRL